MQNVAIETAPWSEQIESDDQVYREQVAYLFEKSAFYRKKLTDAGFASAKEVGGLKDICKLPFTEKDELRATRDEAHPIGTHLAAASDELARIYSTSGTTGLPSYIPLTHTDLATWIEIFKRSYGASGIQPGEKMATTYSAGPFVAGVVLDTFAALGVCHIPVGPGNSERLMAAVKLLKPEVLGCTPSYALYLAEWAEKQNIDIANSSVKRILVAGEPGGGEPALRAKLEKAWGAKVTEVMGIGDISVSLWGECEHQDGMHFGGRGMVHVELINPATGEILEMTDGAEGEIVYTHLRHEAAPLLRFRSRDRVRVSTTPCACGRTAPRVRCIGRTDDMLIVRGVNLFPTAVREVVGQFEPHVSGVISVKPKVQGVKQVPPLPLLVELADGAQAPDDLAENIKKLIRDKLIVTTAVELVPHGTLPRTDYKSKLVDWSGAE